MKAIIMAGGEGTRLRPLTCNLPKPMVPVLNAPMMEHIVRLLKKHDFTKIACTLWYLPDAVIDYFQAGSALGVQLDYFVETEPLGTAGSVKNAAGSDQTPLLIVSGDALTDIDLAAAVAFHKEKEAVATIVLTQVANPLNYGVVLTEPGGRITQFLEKPSWDQVFSDLVNTGIYILEPEVLDLIPDGQKFDFSRDLFPKLLEQGAPLYGYQAQGYWNDIGCLDVYREAIRDCLDGKVNLELIAPQRGNLYIEEDVEIHRSAQLNGPVYLSRGTRIGADALIDSYTVTGENCQIAPRASIKRSILWSGVKIGAGSELRGAVCTKNTFLKPKVELYEGSVLGEKVQVGTLATISPNVKIWPGKIIPSGSRVRNSLVWGSQGRASLFSKFGIAGDYRGDLNPETLIQLGLAYAALVGAGKEILVTADFSQLGHLAKSALIVGLRSGGVHVYDGGDAAGQLTGYAVQRLKLIGALHCAGRLLGENQVVVQCWDETGRLLGKEQQRKLENILAREDFPRRQERELGTLQKAPTVRDDYLLTVASTYPARVKGFKVGLLGSEEAPFGRLIYDYLRLAGYDVVASASRGLPTIVVEEDSWYLQDEQGEPLSEDSWWQIFAQLLGEQGKKEIAVPVHRSQQVEKAARGRGLNVRWTKMEPAFWMEMAEELGNTVQVQKGKIQLFPHVEPLVSMGVLLHYLSGQDTPLSSWQPKTYRQKSEVRCPWDKKGKIMRQLIDDSNPAQTLYLDGVKTFQDQGWVLVVPDGDEPVFRVYSEADTEQKAAELLEHYVELINSYENEER